MDSNQLEKLENQPDNQPDEQATQGFENKEDKLSEILQNSNVDDQDL